MTVSAAARPNSDFAASPRSSLGVEWEMQIIDTDSGELRQEVGRLEDALTVGGEPHQQVHHEIIQSTLEITSKPRQQVRQATRDLRQVIEQVQEVLAPWNARTISSGLHPFSRALDQTITPTEHYQNLVGEAQFWARRNIACGLHVHVGVEDVRKVIPLSNAVMSYVGHLIALAANSPFFEAEDTGYAAFRPTVFRQLPTAGLPPKFRDWDEYVRCVDELTAAQMITSDHNLFWDIRPARHLGTIELRMCDAVSSPREISAVVAVAQCLVEYFSTELDAGRAIPSDPQWMVWRNSHFASRHGREATVASYRDGEVQLTAMPQALNEMLQMLTPTAQRLGCERELEEAARMVQAPSGAERQRQAFRNGGFEAVIRHLETEFDSGFLD
ncbi:MAG: YbdK family carboxylate-amine ligase [Actinomycetaceae bacterium]|nr:YbdK family carboxylate-amine ligase [Actinomycetaceae bacterium]